MDFKTGLLGFSGLPGSILESSFGSKASQNQDFSEKTQFWQSAQNTAHASKNQGFSWQEGIEIAENSEKLGKVLGDHPDGGGKIFAKSGRFGPYVEHNKLRATLPKDISIEEINLDKAIELLIAKAGRPKRSSKKTNKSKNTK